MTQRSFRNRIKTHRSKENEDTKPRNALKLQEILTFFPPSVRGGHEVVNILLRCGGDGVSLTAGV